MTAQHISPEERIRREVVRRNFQNPVMRGLGENEGSIEEIRKQAEVLLPVKRAAELDPAVESEPEVYTRDEQSAIIIIDAIDTLARIERRRIEDAARRPPRSPKEMDGTTPLTRATLEGGRDNF
jgi:hypothetical protein